MALVAFDNTILSVLLFPDADLREGAAGVAVDRATLFRVHPHRGF